MAFFFFFGFNICFGFGFLAKYKLHNSLNLDFSFLILLFPPSVSPGHPSITLHQQRLCLQKTLSSRAVECDNGVCFLFVKRHYHTK